MFPETSAMKKLGALFILLSYLTVFHTEEPAAASVPVYAPVSAQSAILLDPRTNRILYSKRANYRRPGASTTKVITALVILDNISLNRVVTVPRSAEYIPPSKIHLRRGEK